MDKSLILTILLAPAVCFLSAVCCILLISELAKPLDAWLRTKSAKSMQKPVSTLRPGRLVSLLILNKVLYKCG